jgi:hypothetical protein
MLELQDGVTKNSQARIQDEVNFFDQEKKTISASWTQVVWRI